MMLSSWVTCPQWTSEPLARLYILESVELSMKLEKPCSQSFVWRSIDISKLKCFKVVDLEFISSFSVVLCKTRKVTRGQTHGLLDHVFPEVLLTVPVHTLAQT